MAPLGGEPQARVLLRIVSSHVSHYSGERALDVKGLVLGPQGLRVGATSLTLLPKTWKEVS